jgi:hypothetical protein
MAMNAGIGDGYDDLCDGDERLFRFRVRLVLDRKAISIL